MTIDDRLEALTQTVELLAQMQIQTEKAVSAIAEAHAETEKVVKRLGRYAIPIARDHEAGLSSLENGDE